MRWSGLGTLGRIVHPFLPLLGQNRGRQAPPRRTASTDLIQPLHVERAHARAHPMHLEARQRKGTEFIVTVPQGPTRSEGM